MTALSPTLHILLVAAVIHQYRLESRGVVLLLGLAAVALPVHAVLGGRWRARFFVALSLSGLLLVLGPAAGGVVVAVGLGLLGLCHLPLAWGWRIAGLVAVGAALTWARSTTFGEGPLWLQAVWPIVGSMFLFRVALYVYELRVRPREWPGWAVVLGYFFLLPNVAFPLFPVVDFRRFHKGPGQESDGVLWERGGRWMVRGLIHLLLYRLIYHRGVLDPATVEGAGQLLAYMLLTFLLYLRVSGQFHLIVGLLLLFGFSLPETHHRYFLARSLTDFWRRINIYWKDFMTKMVFFPVQGLLRRRWGDRRALVLATAAVFVATWALHVLQWLWLTGRWLFAWHDGLFWGILGALVVVNVVVEDRWGRRRRLGPPSLARRGVTALRILATFTTLTVLWSMWSTEPVALWWHLWSTAPWLAPGLALGIALLLGLSWWIERWGRVTSPSPARAQKGARFLSWWVERAAQKGARFLSRWPRERLSGPLPRLGVLGSLLVLGLPTVHGRLAEPVARGVETLRVSGPNTRDAAELRRGYYEELFAVGIDNPGLRQAYDRAPADWQRIQETSAWRPRDVEKTGWPLPTPGGELVPGARIEFKHAPLTVNRHGMRDRPRELPKPAEAHRLALLGSSHAMGSGVADDATFAARLTAEGVGDAPFEVLNFAVAGYSVLDDLARLELDALPFAPDAVLEVGHTHDAGKIVRVLARHLAEGGDLAGDDPTARALAELVTTTGAAPGQPISVLEHRLRPRRFDLLGVLYHRIATTCRDRGIVPVWILLPLLSDDPAGDDAPTAEQLLELTAAAGFEVLDLRTVYAGLDPAQLRLAPWDEHPNARAHQRIADALEERLLAASWWQRRAAPEPSMEEGGTHPETRPTYPGG